MEENLMKRSDHGRAVKKEKRADSSGDEEAAAAAARGEEIIAKVGDKRPYCENDDMKPSSPGNKDLSSSNKRVSVKSDAERTEPEYSMASSSSRKEQDEQLESAKAEMGEVREENQRLKMYLNRIMKDYQNLQMQFYDIVRQDYSKETKAAPPNDDHQEEVEESELVSLTLGRFSSDSKRDDKNKTSSSSHGKEEEEEIRGKEGLSLSLDCKFEASKSDVDDEPLPNPSPLNSSQEPKEEETWPPSKVLKTMRNADEEVLQQNPVKKARVCVRTRCDTPTMNDGCQWRKYGQKISKGNPCPRAYYRCTVAASCPVRKQVQRCAEDMSILITTYEGNHNHPLPMSATAMASTTSAAASMLLSGSSSSSSSSQQPNQTHANLHGLNFYLSENSKSKFYLPNSSLSAASSHPTITLDLTSTPSSSSSFPFNRFSSGYPTTSRYGSTSLSFGSSKSNVFPWGNGLLSYGSTQPYMKTQIGALNNIGRPKIMENNGIYQSFLQSNTANLPQQQPLPDTIAAATKAITADPNFQSALAAALTSIIGSGNNNGVAATQPAVGESLAQNLKWGDQQQQQTFAVSSSYSQTVNGNGCASSFLSKSPSTTSKPAGSLVFLPPPLPFSTAPKSASTSPADTGNHSN